ncbi:Golgi reassembly-stacking protein 2 [Lunasporangiospora selenospora]|uniref:Golgi reassembly-stacking protein 2 n=1 Tax=Lunasporangiospora selenospora TaxID=979761 RepID=A0A9P6KFV2_9FUNG|nr:Golgi reassembly-stacking protein 2 [Lunasporangiospora selenospora]
MGNTTSGEEGRHRLGYHVLRVKENSPSHQAGIRPFFDYIVAINGVRLNTESTYLQEQMLACENKPVLLDIYSTREQAGRRVEMIPSKDWGDGKGGLIGCSIRFCMFDAVNDVDVAQGSPAERAGLCAHTDYVIGTPYGIMRGEGDLYDLVEDNIGEPLRLHVYNLETDHVREIVIVPSEEWGGEGLLGCDVGYGYLHRLPKQGSGGQQGSEPIRPSQEMAMESSTYGRKGVPTSFAPGEDPFDIVAPTPRPSQSPSWLNPNLALEGAVENASKSKAVTTEGHELPPLRFGRGERPDAEDEPESEEEPEHRAGRGPAAQQAPTGYEGYGNPPAQSVQSQQQVSPLAKQFQALQASEASEHLPQREVGEVNPGEIPFGSSSSNQSFSFTS